ncbi:MAG: HAD-IIIA family hydrolase [Phycisphaerae bacterium]|jgi:3-deoxy-D-manno-octulosonate 8-phosphate phosphatase (KDO 8-P phosphatase)
MNDIRCLCLDVDGVLTDGRIYMDADGRSARAFHVHDGFAIRMFQELGGVVAILSGKDSPAVAARAEELGITHVIQGSRDKRADLESLAARLDLRLEQIAVVGDDLPDLPALHHCGLPIAVANAAEEVKAAAEFITQRRGGEGAVREVIEHLLRADGRWQQVHQRYAPPAGGGQPG